MARVLWPHPAGVRVEAVSAAGPTVWIEARTSPAPVACPVCGTVSGRVYSRYDRLGLVKWVGPTCRRGEF